MRFVLTIALLALPTAAFATIYNIDLRIGAGTATGQVITDGTLGTLSAGNILDWNITLSDGVNTVVLTGPLSGNNSSFTVLGSNLSATPSQLLFAFTPAGQNYAFFETNGSPVSFLCFTSNSTTCAAGPAGQESILLKGTYYATFPTGVQQIAVALEAFQIGYAANLGAGDSIFNLTNTGASGGYEPGGDICANVYVFDPDQELIACCSCPLTPNHLKTLSAQKDLINNTLTPGAPTAISVAVVASTACDASTVALGNLVPSPVAWGTTLHSLPAGGYGVTETKLQKAELSETELQKLATFCGYIESNGSGYGICNSCRTGAAGAAKQ